jgi:hypothetical protein
MPLLVKPTTTAAKILPEILAKSLLVHLPGCSVNVYVWRRLDRLCEYLIVGLVGSRASQ